VVLWTVIIQGSSIIIRRLSSAAEAAELAKPRGNP
jgi:hypothetical protein